MCARNKCYYVRRTKWNLKRKKNSKSKSICEAGEKNAKPEMKSVFVVLCDACVVIFVGEALAHYTLGRKLVHKHKRKHDDSQRKQNDA